jgi:hypothetical protein
MHFQLQLWSTFFGGKVRQSQKADIGLSWSGPEATDVKALWSAALHCGQTFVLLLRTRIRLAAIA